MLIYLQMLETEEDQSKFEKLYNMYRDMLFCIAWKILKNEMDAEDAVHQAFVTIAENFSKIGELECPETKSYIVIIVRCRCYDIGRSKKRHQYASYEDALSDSVVDYDGPIALASCLAKLNSRYRDALLLKFRLGLTNKEIAAVYKITVDSATKLVQRAKKKLEELCKKEGLL